MTSLNIIMSAYKKQIGSNDCMDFMICLQRKSIKANQDSHEMIWLSCECHFIEEYDICEIIKYSFKKMFLVLFNNASK